MSTASFRHSHLLLSLSGIRFRQLPTCPLSAAASHTGTTSTTLWQHGRMQVAELPLDSPSHEAGVIIDYIYCPPPQSVVPRGTVLLIHGFPQTSYQFRRAITPLAKKGWHVIVPNYRGAGGSSKPWNGYTKQEMARDLHTLVVGRLGVRQQVHVGHDIGVEPLCGLTSCRISR